MICTETLYIDYELFAKSGFFYPYKIEGEDLYIYGEEGRIMQIQFFRQDEWIRDYFALSSSFQKIS